MIRASFFGLLGGAGAAATAILVFGELNLFAVALAAIVTAVVMFRWVR